ncbi:MAG TPA: hypothetical protein VGK00_10880 [Anaerolineales bacterium]|jgi:PBP1b-binding outer membrane lipoprotein LpoB
MVFITLLALITVGCTTGKNTGQGEVTKPQPQVRVQALPSATATLPLPVEAAAPPPVASATVAPAAGQVYIEPTPDEDALVNQIDSMMDDIDRKLRNEDFLLK